MLRCSNCNTIKRPVVTEFTYDGADGTIITVPRSVQAHSPKFIRLKWVCPRCGNTVFSEIERFIWSRDTYSFIPYDIKADYLKHHGVAGHKQYYSDFRVDTWGKEVKHK